MPAMLPPPWMFSAPSSSCMFKPASVEISRNGEPRSRRWARRWRGVSWPRFWNMGSFGVDVPSPGCSSARNCSTSASMSRRLAWNASDLRIDLGLDDSHRAWVTPPAAPSAARRGGSRGRRGAVVRRLVVVALGVGCGAVHAQGLAGDEGRRRRQQEDDGRRDLGLRSQALQRRLCRFKDRSARLMLRDRCPCRRTRSSPAPPR